MDKNTLHGLVYKLQMKYLLPDFQEDAFTILKLIDNR